MKRVFISYSHRDIRARRFLHTNLLAQGIEVEVDELSLEAGEDLTDSLRAMIHKSDYTICLVSEASLHSSWVLWEINQALAQAGEVDGSKLIPCYLDDSFQDPNAIDKINDKVGDEIEQLNELRDKAAVENLADDHLADRRNRLIRFRNDLPLVVQKLNAVNVVDLTPMHLEKGFLSLYKKITGDNCDSLPVALMDVAEADHSDYQSRLDNIFDEIINDHTKEAAKKAMDLVREFLAEAKALLRKLGVLCASIVRLEDAYSEGKIKFNEYDDKLKNYADQIMELLPDSPDLA